MDRLTLPFKLDDLPSFFRTLEFYGDPEHVIRRFVSFGDLDETTGDACTWRRDGRATMGEFGLIFTPDDYTRIKSSGNTFICPDPHRAFFTLMRAVYPRDPVHQVTRSDWVQVQPEHEIEITGSVITNTVIGSGLLIGRNCTIGGPGFGFVLEPDGSRWRVPHIGRVIIEDDVQIGSNTCIDRGCLGDTIIREGARIDNLVHIAHNVEIGRNAVVVANAMIAGSAKIGDGAWIAPGAHVRNGVTVGENAVVGMMANVVKDVAPGVTVMGNPARER